jgi:hypothetical protein
MWAQRLWWRPGCSRKGKTPFLRGHALLARRPPGVSSAGGKHTRPGYRGLVGPWPVGPWPVVHGQGAGAVSVAIRAVLARAGRGPVNRACPSPGPLSRVETSSSRVFAPLGVRPRPPRSTYRQRALRSASDLRGRGTPNGAPLAPRARPAEVVPRDRPPAGPTVPRRGDAGVDSPPGDSRAPAVGLTSGFKGTGEARPSSVGHRDPDAPGPPRARARAGVESAGGCSSGSWPRASSRVTSSCG